MDRSGRDFRPIRETLRKKRRGPIQVSGLPIQQGFRLRLQHHAVKHLAQHQSVVPRRILGHPDALEPGERVLQQRSTGPASMPSDTREFIGGPGGAEPGRQVDLVPPQHIYRKSGTLLKKGIRRMFRMDAQGQQQRLEGHRHDPGRCKRVLAIPGGHAHYVDAAAEALKQFCHGEAHGFFSRRNRGWEPYNSPSSFETPVTMTRLTHFDESGSAHMVDVGGKPATQRTAVAEGYIEMQPATLAMVMAGTHRKGDVLGIARIAGIMAGKKTSELIPLCHPIALAHLGLDFEPQPEHNRVRCVATAKTTGPTGVEMEALAAVQIALLTIYDMCKAVDRGMAMQSIRLLEKAGGKSGHWRREP